MHLLPIISHEVKAMKFGQLIECNKIHFFFRNYAENEAGRLVPELSLF